MSQDKSSWQDDLSDHPAREYITYIIAGVISLGLVGWLLGMVLSLPWILFVGLGLGAVLGAYIAWRHLVDHKRSKEKSDLS